MRGTRQTRATTALLKGLSERIQAVHQRHAGQAPHDRASFVPTGWNTVDRVLVSAGACGTDRDVADEDEGANARGDRGGLACGAIHEWFGLVDGAGNRPTSEPWTPPLCILTHLAWQAITETDLNPRPPGSPRLPRLPRFSGAVVWIGRRVWPHAPMLLREGERGDDSGGEHGQALLRQSVFIDPPVRGGGRSRTSGGRGTSKGTSGGGGDLRVWAMDLALRSPAVSVVIADGSGLSMAATRRLQLAAEAGHGLALLARPANDLTELSAAATRWRVCREPASHQRPRWTVELLRCKGVQPARWSVEWDRATWTVVIPADVADRSGPTKEAADGEPFIARARTA